MQMSRLPSKCHNLKFGKTISRWDEAIMLGNGHVGCLIWGESNALRLSLDRGDIWDKTPYKGVLEEDFTYEKLVTLVKNKEVEAIREQFDAPYYNPTPTKLPAGKIIVDFKQNVNIVSELDLGSATAHLEIGETIKLKSYLHATLQAGFVQITGPSDTFEIKLKRPKFGKITDQDDYHYNSENRSISQGDLATVKYEEATWYKQDGVQYFIQKIDNSLYYGIFMVQKKTDVGIEIVYSVVTHTNNDKVWIVREKVRLLAYLNRGYKDCLREHEIWWEAFWNKSLMNLPDKMFEKQWYLTNYFLGSASRKGAMPMPLQGVWSADDDKLPPWKGDYHNDLNTQMTYYHYLKANHLEEGETFINFLWDLVPKAKLFAENFYGAKGLCLPAVMAIDGTALGGWPMYSLSPTQQLWLCQAFERHYRFTGDKVFLANKAYPYMVESANCILDILTINDEGKLILPVSSSSEIHDDTLAAWVTPNSNYDLALLIYLFKQLYKMAGELENGEATKWHGILEKLPSLAVNNDHVLMISPNESLMESHRHFSHAMGIHPLRLLNYDNEKDKDIIDATVLNLEVLGSGMWVGFSFTWLAELFAIQRNGEGAYYQLKLFWENFCSPNGFHINGDYKHRGLSQFHYRPFTLEANFCAADALQEMLLRTDYNVIEVFPAIPEAWKEETIIFEDFRGEKGILISAKYENGMVKHITLKPKYTGEYTLKIGMDTMQIQPSCQPKIKGDFVTLGLQGGEVYQLSHI
ncbi:MAG: glycoside hydrolase N-terminal domain-containing protein [Cellulosilyticaceae bacterium]